MSKHYMINGSAAELPLPQDYESVLSEVSSELSDTEYEHLLDIADIGYEHASQKDDYIVSLCDTVYEWAAEARRAKLHLTQGSTDFAFDISYNNTDEVRNEMKRDQCFSVIPAFFVYFGAVVLALFCIFATIFMIGLCQSSFPVNPVYLFMFTVGFLGLLLTDIVAIVEWRKGQDVQK